MRRRSPATLPKSMAWPKRRRQGRGRHRHDQGPDRRADRQGADRRAGLSDRHRTGRICLARRAAPVAGRSRRRLAALRSARGSGQGAQGRRPLRRCACRRSATGRSRSRSGRSRRGANMPVGARRARPATSTSGPSRCAPIRSRPSPSSAGHERLCRLAAAARDERARRPPSRSPTREVDWMRRDGVALPARLGVPLLAFAILAATFSNAVIRDLRVDVVDADRLRDVADLRPGDQRGAGVTVAERSNDLNDAMQAVRSGEAIAAVYIPREPRARPRWPASGRRSSTSTTGSTSRRATSPRARFRLRGLGGDRRPAAPPAAQRAITPGTLVVEQYVLTNPALNYVQFLLRAIMPTVLHVVIAIAGGYAVGSEFGRTRHGRLAGDGGRQSARRACRQARALSRRSSC